MLNNFFLNSFDQHIAIQILNFRTNRGIGIFQVITLFGNWQLIVPAILIIIILLFLKHKTEFIYPFAVTIASAEVVTFFGKLLFHRGRPLLAVINETDFSFPSGHATIAVAFYGYLAYFFIKSLKDKYTWPIIILTFLIIILIGFSRLYLGVHYLSDVLAGYLVGGLALIGGIVWTEKLNK